MTLNGERLPVLLNVSEAVPTLFLHTHELRANSALYDTELNFVRYSLQSILRHAPTRKTVLWPIAKTKCEAFEPGMDRLTRHAPTSALSAAHRKRLSAVHRVTHCSGCSLRHRFWAMAQAS